MISKVLIVGGGVIGLSIARELHKRGAGRVTVVERGVCGEKASWAAAGMLGPQAEAESPSDFLDFCIASRQLYPELALGLLDETGIDIELDRTGTLYLAFAADEIHQIRNRYDWQRAAGMDVTHLSADETRRIEPFISTDVSEALFFPNDWQVENRKLVSALKRYAQLNGIEILENTNVQRLLVEDARVVGVDTKDDRLFAEETILATGAWTSLIKVGVADMVVNIEPVRGQMVTFQTAKRLFRHVIYGAGGYIVPRLDGRVLVGSTTEKVGFDRSLTTNAASALRRISGQIAPSTAGLPTTDHWSGLRPLALDGLPVIGRFDGIKGVTIATGHYRNGILLAPLTAKIVADSILAGAGGADAFTPDRFRLRSMGNGQ